MRVFKFLSPFTSIELSCLSGSGSSSGQGSGQLCDRVFEPLGPCTMPVALLIDSLGQIFAFLWTEVLCRDTLVGYATALALYLFHG
jgi:hypothetical protein